MKKGILGIICAASLLVLPACSDDVVPLDTGPDIGIDGSLVEAGLDTGPGIEAGGCSLVIEAYNVNVKGKKTEVEASKKTAFSSADDLDTTKAGIQVGVIVKVNNSPDGTKVSLAVTGQITQDALSTGKKATFTTVTIDSKLQLVTLKASAAGCTDDSATKTVVPDPSCSIISPTKATLTSKDNEDTTGSGKFKYSIIVATANAYPGDVDLSVSASATTPSPANPTSSKKTLNAVGTVTFTGTEMNNGDNYITATVRVQVDTATELKATCKPATDPVKVNTTAPACTCCKFTKGPTYVDSTKCSAPGVTLPVWGLGATHDTNTGTANLQTTITVDKATNADQVELDLGSGVVLKKTGLSGKATATFAVNLADGLYNLTATCTDTTTSNTGKQSFKVVVDTAKPVAISDLACKVSHNRTGKIQCDWTSISDGAKGIGVNVYQVRYRKNSTISAANFDDTATVKLTDVAAAASSSAQNTTVAGLAMPSTYSFAAKAVDCLGNTSDLSNLPTAAKIDFNVQEMASPSPTSDYQFGTRVTVGDYNCDGNTDLAVGEMKANAQPGKVYIYWGSGSGGTSSGTPFPKNPSTVIEGTLTGAKFGSQMTSLQFDGDSNKCDDLAIWAMSADGGRGRVYLYLGHKGTWSPRDDVTAGKGAEVYYMLATSATTSEKLGTGITSLDLDGDNKYDLALGHYNKTSKVASVFVMYGKSGIPLMSGSSSPIVQVLPANADVIIQGRANSYGEGFGQILANGGTLNKDKYHDLLIGASWTDSYKGAAWLVTGAARTTGQQTITVTTSPRATEIKGTANSYLLGEKMAGLGDINNDGNNEFAIGEHWYNSAAATKYVGQVHIFTLGSSAAPTSVTQATAVITNDHFSPTENFFGRGLANGANVDPAKGADVNKDGFADLMCGSKKTGAHSYGSLFMFFGATGTITNRTASKADYIVNGVSGATSYGLYTAFLPDTTGDGYIDIMVSEPYYNGNRGRIWLYY